METGTAPHHVDDLMALLDVSRQLAAPTELSPLLQRIARAARSVLCCERATVFLYDSHNHELYSSFATEEGNIRFGADLGIAGEALRTGKVISVPDAYADPRFNREIDRRTGFTTRNMITFPLVGFEGQPVGALQVLNKATGAFNPRDEKVAATMSSLAGIAVQRQMLMDQYAEKQKMERDLALARHIQQSLLPAAHPRVSGYDIAGFNQPADATGGDCYDYIPLADKRMGVMIADATGHGIGPALLVAQLRAMLRAMATVTPDPLQMLARTNDLLCDDLPDGMFITAFLGILEPGTGQITYLSAGHGPILIYRQAKANRVELRADAVPLGVLAPMEVTPPEPIALDVGDLVMLVTDGFFESVNDRGEQFGTSRLFDIAQRCAAASAENIILTMVAELSHYCGAIPPNDDLTAIVIRRTQ